MFRYLDTCLAMLGNSWYDVGSNHWYHNGEVRGMSLAG